MATQRYTNQLLTVIAACLLILVLEPVYTVGEAQADSARPRGETLNVNLVEIGGWELLKRSTLPVEIESGPVPVEILGSAGAPGCCCP